MEKIAVIPNSGKDLGLVNTKRLVQLLCGKVQVYMDKAYSVLGMDINYAVSSEVFDSADCAIVLGGDGTMLGIASECALRKIPVLGINLGKVGFMTEVEVDDMETAIDSLLSNNFKIENRMMIEASIKKEGNDLFSFRALNDIVISKTMGEKLICMELSTGEEEVNCYRGDGLIIATPTGSTGYSISAGGPVVDPRMRLYVSTPICPHMLSARSAVLSCEEPLKIKLNCLLGDCEAVVTADGDVQGHIKESDEVIINKSEYDFRLIRLGDRSFYDTLIKKLS